MSKMTILVLTDVTPNRGTVKSKHRSLKVALGSGVPRSHIRRTRLAVAKGDRIWTSDTRAV